MKPVITFFGAIALMMVLIILADEQVIRRLYALVACCIILPTMAVVVNYLFSKAQEKHEKSRRGSI